ncbi:MAG: ribonuclease HI family protein [Patescibacteria group bacterium]|jgi:ribonuclease HI
MSFAKITIYTDGGARGNPGPAGIGAIAYDPDGAEVFIVSEFLGVATNNQAEYKAVIAALEKARVFNPEELDFYLDSELVVKQLKREYKVKNEGIAPLFLKVHNLTLGFKKVKFTHIPREKNKEADRLANEAMDRGK